MHDEEMHEITNTRTMGALPFGGRYRLIDFQLSNMRNSGITCVGVITKSNYQSLLEHLGSGREWDLSRKREGLFIFSPFCSQNTGIYKNKVEALNSIMGYIKNARKDYVVITDCDTICNINWNEPIEYHKEKKADITLLYYEVNPIKERKNETVYHISNEGYITDILMNQTIQSSSFVNTNMWIINRNLLIKMIEDAVAHSLESIEKDIFQKKMNQFKIAAWEMKGYVKKTNSIYDYFQANIDLLESEIRNELFTKNGSIYTKEYDVVSARYTETAEVTNSLVADGSVIEGKVENSILFRSVKVGKGSTISNSVIMDDCLIGENVSLNYILADKNVVFNDNRTLAGYELHPSYISKGSIV
jgi:glucose-1-phosphate adenylyltransferase